MQRLVRRSSPPDGICIIAAASQSNSQSKVADPCPGIADRDRSSTRLPNHAQYVISLPTPPFLLSFPSLSPSLSANFLALRDRRGRAGICIWTSRIVIEPRSQSNVRGRAGFFQKRPGLSAAALELSAGCERNNGGTLSELVLGATGTERGTSLQRARDCSLLAPWVAMRHLGPSW